MTLSFCIACGLAVFAVAEPILWDGVWDPTGKPKGMLLTTNPKWYGERVYTGVRYDYEIPPNNPHDIVMDDLKRPCQRLFERYRHAPAWNSVGRADGQPIVLVFDFKRPCRFTELDVFHMFCTNATGFVEFSSDRTNWCDRTEFDAVGASSRVRFAKMGEGRYLRLGFLARPDLETHWLGRMRKGHTLLEEVYVWGYAEVSERYPEEMDATYAGDALLFTNAAPNAVSILPMRIPHLDRKPSGATPKSYPLSMARNETENRYFAVVNRTTKPVSLTVEKPSFGPGVATELLIGGVMRKNQPKIRLTDLEMQQMMTTNRYGLSSGDLGELDVCAYFRPGRHNPKRLMRHYFANAEQIIGFPQLKLEPDEGCVIMLRVTSDNARPGNRSGVLQAGNASLPFDLKIVNLTLPPQRDWIYAYEPFTVQYPFESLTRVKRDVAAYVGIGVTAVSRLPEPRTKEAFFFKQVPNASVGTLEWCDEGAFLAVQNNKFDEMKESERQKLADSAAAFVRRAKELGVSPDRVFAFLPDETGTYNARSLMKAAAYIKSKVPDVRLFCNPLFFTFQGAEFNTEEEIRQNLLPEFNRFVDASCPIRQITESRPNILKEVWSQPRLVNAQYAHPAGKTGREMAYQGYRCGFNGMAYYGYFPNCSAEPWDVRKYGGLGLDYEAVLPLEEDVALTALYETLREAAEDCRMLTALKETGKTAVLADVLERSKTAWDRTHFQYKLFDPAQEDILDLRMTILEAFAD